MDLAILIIIIILICLLAVMFQNQTIISKLNQMSQSAAEIKQALADAQAKVTKVAADVTALHAKIDALGDAPTADEINEIKAMAADLNSSLQAVDDQTADE